MQQKKELYLRSPYDYELLLKFSWPLVNQERNDLIETIKLVRSDHPTIESHLPKDLFKGIDGKCYEKMSQLCDTYNKTLEQLKEKSLLYVSNERKKSSKHLLKYIMQLIYNRSVCDPDKLNQYEPFSPQVYGETSFDLIDQMLSQMTLSASDTFLDLGSGVGNVVLQVAGTCTHIKLAFGMEKADWPAKYAEQMSKEFKEVMKWFGKVYCEYKLVKGDFLKDDCHNIKSIIETAKLVFVNNYAFGAEVDHQLKIRFREMQQNSFIVSSKPFCSLTFRINERNLSDIGAILNVNEIPAISGHVSWTDKPIQYFFHKIDQTQLLKYFESQKSSGTGSTGSNESSSNVANNNTGGASGANNVNTSSEKRRSRPVSANQRQQITQKRSSNTSDSSDEEDVKSKQRKKLKKDKIKKKHIKEDNNKRTTSSHANRTSSANSANHSPIKSIDSNLMDTLNIMHNCAKKASQITANPTNPNIDSNYNVKTMTKLTNENLDNRLLTDCLQTDFNEIEIRDQLGIEISNEIDRYLETQKRHLLNYLLHMKSPQYRESLKKQIQKEVKRQNDLIESTKKVEGQIDRLHKQGIILLKSRVKELGLNDIQVPNDLIKFATDILHKHQELLSKAAELQQTVDELQIKNENLTRPNRGGNNGVTSSSSSSCKKSVVVVVVDKTPAKNKCDELTRVNNDVNSKGEGDVAGKTLAADVYEPITPMKNENIVVDSPVHSTSSSSSSSPSSGSSTPSNASDETLTATEKEDNEDESDSKSKKCVDKTTIKTAKNEPIKKAAVSITHKQKPISMVKKHTPVKSVEISKTKAQKCNTVSASMTYFNTIKSTEALKNFKIPKSTKAQTDDTNLKPQQCCQNQDENMSEEKFYGPRTPPGTPPRTPLSSSNRNISPVSCRSRSSSTSSTSTSDSDSKYKLVMSNVGGIHKSSSAYSNEHSNDSSFSNNSNLKGYYHPKKTHFRQYMMENQYDNPHQQHNQHHHHQSLPNNSQTNIPNNYEHPAPPPVPHPHPQQQPPNRYYTSNSHNTSSGGTTSNPHYSNYYDQSSYVSQYKTTHNNYHQSQQQQPQQQQPPPYRDNYHYSQNQNHEATSFQYYYNQQATTQQHYLNRNNQNLQ